MEKTFETEGPVEAEVLVPAGDIEVDAAEGNTATVVLEAARGGRRAEEIIAETEVTFSGGKLRVHVPQRALRNVEVRCRLRLPEGSTLGTKTASADVRSSISLRAFDGTTASGDAGLTDVTEHVSYKSASGDFTCATVGGRLRVKSASGDVMVRRTSGEVEIDLASGDVHIQDADTSVEVRSASGDVSLDCVRRGRVKAQTASGDVSISVAKGIGAFLDVTSVSGETECTLPFHEGEPVADAQVQIVARTVSGDVVVKGAGR